MLRIVEDRVDTAPLDDVPFSHDGSLVSDVSHDGHVMRDEQHRHTFIGQLTQEVEDPGLHCDIKGRGGLVSDDHPRIACQGQGHACSLQLASGQLMRVGGSDPLYVRQPDAAQELMYSVANSRTRPILVRVGPDDFTDLSADGQKRVKRTGGLLKDGADQPTSHTVEHRPISPNQFHGCLAGVSARFISAQEHRSRDRGGLGQQAEAAQGCHGFPRSRLAHQSQYSSRHQIQIDSLRGRHRRPGESHRDISQAQDCV